MIIISCSGDYNRVETNGCAQTHLEDEMNRQPTIVHLSMLLVERIRDEMPTDDITDCLANISSEKLESELNTEEQKKAFWLNVYNAYVQIILQENPGLFEDRNSWFGYNFFSSPQVTIAGYRMSFDDMEHGIMRRSTHKLSLGYMRNWFIDDVEKDLMWEEIDPRIHFALNCGAASCPYVAVYDPQRVNEQLDKTTENYLSRTTVYDASENTVRVTKLMSWFRGDFGGLDGAKEFLKKYDVIPQDADPTLEFREYDWTLDLDNFQDL
ncbi:MAG: DUF547 domain-containing protein [Balneolaceae bacterium]|nr:DUF547 domain-containing protein [Balneolaceae bacterium]MDR9409832.1 DUF547 domain-containing protein [Balneolaceae bacterium]